MVDFAKMIQQKREQHNIEMKPASNTQVSISVAGPDYAIRFGFDRALLDKLKAAVPASEITWHKARKVWLVHPDEINKALDAIKAHTGQTIKLPEAKPSTPEVIEKTFLLEYLGATKDRGKRKSAYGSVNGDWSIEITEDVLRGFFEGREIGKPEGLQTFYQVLCVLEKATSEEIKKAYRRLALQWHPDRCKEPDAAEMFRTISEAYQVLNNPEQKRRYDAGLYFERQEGRQEGVIDALSRSRSFQFGYRAPLRCGQVTARGTVRLMRFIINEILKWEDVTNERGQVMTSQWPKGSDTFQIEWV